MQIVPEKVYIAKCVIFMLPFSSVYVDSLCT